MNSGPPHGCRPPESSPLCGFQPATGVLPTESYWLPLQAEHRLTGIGDQKSIQGDNRFSGDLETVNSLSNPSNHSLSLLRVSLFKFHAGFYQFMIFKMMDGKLPQFAKTAMNERRKLSS